MAIEKYGRVFRAGIGYYGSYDWKISFGVSMRSKTVSEVRAEFRPSVVPVHPVLTRNGSQETQPLYVVYDGETGIWKEYLTGRTVGERKSGFGADWYVVDGNNERFCDVLTASWVAEVKPDEFAGFLQKYTRSELQSMAEQVQRMYAAADVWKAEFERKVAEVRAEMKRREENNDANESQIAAGFGAYANVKAGSTAAGGGNVYVTSEQQLAWIREGKCSRCGGTFRGLFTKRCAKCGKEKDY